MPRRRSSLKRKRADKKRHLYNLRIKKGLQNTTKKFKKLLQAKNLSEARTKLNEVFSRLDKAAKKRVLHPNLASRRKSRLSRLLLKATQANQ